MLSERLLLLSLPVKDVTRAMEELGEEAARALPGRLSANHWVKI